MRTIIIVSAALLSGCSEAPAVTYDDISKRDMVLAKEMDKTAALEKRVEQLEADAKIQKAIVKANQKEAIAATDKIETDNHIRDMTR